MNKKEVVLSNGVKLLMINTEKFKTVDVRVFFEDKLNAKNITCYTLMLKLLTTKTNNYPTRKAFKTYLQDLYDMKVKSFTNTYGETFSFSLDVNSLNSKYSLNGEDLLSKQFEVLEEVLYNPLGNDSVFDEDYFNEIKNEYKENLLDMENYKEVVVKKKACEILGKDNNLIEMSEGYLTELNDLYNEDVFDKYKQINDMCKQIIVVGEIEFDRVEALVTKYLTVSCNRKNNRYLYRNEMKKYEDYSFESKFNQSSIGILFDVNVYFNDKLYYPMCLFVEMFNYYLFKIVREEHNFCYSIYATYLGSKGLCYLQSNIEAKNYEMTLKLISEIIEDLRNNIDVKVLDICKSKIINSLKKEEDSPLKLIAREYFKDLYELKDNEEVIKIIQSVDADKIKEAANKVEKKFSVIVKEAN